jgi:hypothetical protein
MDLFFSAGVLFLLVSMNNIEGLIVCLSVCLFVYNTHIYMLMCYIVLHSVVILQLSLESCVYNI